VAAYLIFWKPPAPVECSAPAVSVSMSVALRGAKKLRADTDFGGILTVTNVETLLVDFLADCEVSLELCLLRFFISRKSSFWAFDYDEILFAAPLWFGCALTAFSSFGVTVYMQ
jgi:hypothetical protein